MSRMSQKDKNAIIPPLEKMDSTPKLVLSNNSISKMAQLESMAKSYDLPTPKWHFDSKARKKRRRANTSIISSSILSEPIIDDLEETFYINDNETISNKSKETTQIEFKSEKSETDHLSKIIIEPSVIVQKASTPVPITTKAVTPEVASKIPTPIAPPTVSPSPPPPPPQKPSPPRPKSTKKLPPLPSNFKPNDKKKRVFSNFVVISGVVTTLIYVILRGQQLGTLQTTSAANGDTNKNNLNDKKVSFPSQTTPKSNSIQSNSTLNSTDSTTSSSLNCFKTCVNTNLLNDNQIGNFLADYAKITWNVLLANLQTQPNLTYLTLNETFLSSIVINYKKNLNDAILSNLNNSTCYSSCSNTLSISNNSNHSLKKFNTFVYFLIVFFILNIL